MKTDISSADFKLGHTYLKDTEVSDTSISYTYLGDKLNYLSNTVSLFYTQTKKEFEDFGLQKLFVTENISNFLQELILEKGVLLNNYCIISNNYTRTLDYILNEKKADNLFDKSVNLGAEKVFIKDNKEHSSIISPSENYDSILNNLAGISKCTGNSSDSNIMSFKDIVFNKDISVLPNYSDAYQTIKFAEPPLYNSHLLINRYTPEELYKKEILNYIFKFDSETLSLLDVLFLSHLHAYFAKDITYFLTGGENYDSYSRYVIKRNYNVDVLEGKSSEYIKFLEDVLLIIQDRLENLPVDFN